MLFSDIKIRNGRITSKDESRDILYQNIPIHIETDVGEVRHWETDNEKGETIMLYDYGFIRGTCGADNEEIDCFVNIKNPYESKVFIIRQHNENGKGFDEEKVMFGFSSMESARDAYLAHYNSQKFLGEITEIPMYLFRETLEYKI